MYAWLFILFLFCVLVLVGIKYDQIVPYFLNIAKTRRLNVWYLVLGLFFLSVSFIFLGEKSEFQSFSPGAQSSSRWGFPVHTRLWFDVMFIFGIISIILAFLRGNKDDPSKSNGVFNKICISCGEIFKGKANFAKCPKCGGAIENISGVMKRHPDLLKKVKKSL